MRALAIGIFPPLVTVTIGVLLMRSDTHALAHSWLDEDRAVEWATFAFLFAGGILALALPVALRGARGARRDTLVSLALGGALLTLAFEEISWGQRLLGFATPAAVERVNVQGEFNLHNLPWVDDASEFAIVALGLAGLLLTRLAGHPRWGAWAAPRVLIPCFVVIVVFTGLDLLTYRFPIERRFDDALVDLDEVVEMLVGFAGLVYVTTVRARFRAEPAGVSGRPRKR